jgi:hypothetical protein
MKKIYKTTNLFGDEEIKIVEKKQKKTNIFNDYESFVDKFKKKKQQMIAVRHLPFIK